MVMSLVPFSVYASFQVKRMVMSHTLYVYGYLFVYGKVPMTAVSKPFLIHPASISMGGSTQCSG